MKSIICLVPARMESSRYPGKALELIENQAMVVRCAKNAIDADLHTWVCTDSELIRAACQQASVNVIKTPQFSTGTDRCAWAIQYIKASHVIILQGDEPLVQPESLKLFREKVETYKYSNALFNGITELANDSFLDLNVVKASCRNNRIRSLTRKFSQDSSSTIMRQMGLYGGSTKDFIKFAGLTSSPAEKESSIEMLRWIDHGFSLFPVELAAAPYSVDTPNDMKKCHSFLRTQKHTNHKSSTKKPRSSLIGASSRSI